MSDNAVRLQQVKKQITLINMVNMLPNIMLGFALYGLFVAEGNASIALLNDKQFCYGLIAISLVVEAFTMSYFIRLVREKARLLQEE